MLLYLLLIAAFGLLILAAIGMFIFSLVKKKRSLLITAVVLFCVAVVACIYSGVKYTQKTIEYVSGEGFQNDTKKASKLVGETLGSATSGASDGLSNTLDDQSIRKLASKSATILSTVTKTVASNLDSTLGTNIYMDSSLLNTGFEFGRAEENHLAETNDLAIFIAYKKEFSGKLRLTNYDQKGLKIESIDKSIQAKANSEKVEVFSFEHSDFGLTTYFILSAVK